MEKKKRLDPKVYFGLMMGLGSLAAGAIKLHLFDGGLDWVFWSLAAVWVAGVAALVWYVGMRRFHSETRTFIDRPARKPSPRHDEGADS